VANLWQFAPLQHNTRLRAFLRNLGRKAAVLLSPGNMAYGAP